eukprot:TRINITY_DN1893_c0_g1_i1.p1 TRINITY_DN1893_c0_g1~~TRINITY_DN1893_c0_g1_i1.p1  ORF type:complete len:338 (+),score=94.35 TRINITY_DN1893_c0_g1_i1:108-1121(+)
MSSPNFRELLKQNISIGATKSDIISVKSTESLAHCFNTLSSARIHAVPIQNEQNQFTNFVDVWDIVHYLFSTFSTEELRKNQIPKMMEWHGEFVRVLDEKQPIWDVPKVPEIDPKVAEFRNKTVGTIEGQPFVSVGTSSTLNDLLNVMATKRLHRVPVVDANGSLERLVSQMDLIRWIDHNMDALGDVASQTVAQLSLDSDRQDLFKASTSITALEAFKLINDKKISGVPVVDENDKIVGNISTSDLKVALSNTDEFLRLYQPVKDYLQVVKERDTHVPDRRITCTSKTSFRELVHSFAGHHVHRIFVEDDQQRLTGVVTLTDVLSAFNKQANASNL